jgi:L-lactate dehydrogenase complex protein LldG
VARARRDPPGLIVTRDSILHKVRSALARSVGQAPQAPPEVVLNVPEVSARKRIDQFRRNLEALAGKTYLAATVQEAREQVARILGGRAAVASNSPFLEQCSIPGVEGVRAGLIDPAELRVACAQAPVGITSADFALADTGTLVMIASASEARLVSLLPPVHVAVVPCGRILTGLDELFTILPDPAAQTSSMVLITGPSRTADIEQILVRGVHGPGEVHVVLVDSET